VLHTSNTEEATHEGIPVRRRRVARHGGCTSGDEVRAVPCFKGRQLDYSLPPGGSTLAQLLACRRDVPNPNALPSFTIKQILDWADLHHHRYGYWPNSQSGPIDDAPEETWSCVNRALQGGYRGLKGGSTLARLLVKRRGVLCHKHQPELTVEQILRWTDAHRERTGHWPNMASGPVVDAPGECWSAINQALLHGFRGLPGRCSLARLLAESRGASYQKRSHERLTCKQVLAWARAHRRRTGRWPTENSGLIQESWGDTWHGVDAALRKGSRGLPGGSSVSRLIKRYRRWNVRLKGR
jgi:hypothetical protein